MRRRLQLFRDICSAVSHAHQNLIVHRDLKPANILVTADGTVKLLDFGIAKLLQPDFGSTAGAQQTVTSVNTLTLDFASPEQALGKTITTASDVYSLGVILYVLLTRRLPYLMNVVSLHEAIREICEVEPPRPSAAVSQLGRRSPGRPAIEGSFKLDADLDAITLRALRKEPARRYRSVDEFSEDVRRYLEGLPVVARGGQLAYRAGKFVRRRRLELIAASVFAMMLTGGIVASLHQARLAEEQRARAERHVETVRGFAELSMFQLHDAIKDLPGSTAARELLISTAQKYLGALASEAHRNRALQHDIAVAYAKVGDIQGKAYNANTGQPKEAVASYQKAIELLEPLVAADPTDAEKQTSLAQSYLQQSRLWLLLGESKKAVAGSKRATEIFETRARMNPSTATRAVFADSMRIHAMNLALDDGGHDKAVPFARRSVAILEELHRENPGDTDLEYQLGVAYGTAGDVLATGEPGSEVVQEALELNLKALAVDERLVEHTHGRNTAYVRALASDRVNLCQHYTDTHEYDRAIELCRGAQPLLQSLTTDDRNGQSRVDIAVLNWNLSYVLLAAGHIGEASGILEPNIRALEKLASETDTVQIQYLLAACEQGMGKVYADRATRAPAGGSAQRRDWKTAHDWFAKAVPIFEAVSKQVSLDHSDRGPMDDAIAGLARSKAELARLEGATRK